MNGFAALDIPPCRRYVVVKATAGFAVCRLILKLLLFYSCLDFTQNLGKTRTARGGKYCRSGKDHLCTACPLCTGVQTGGERWCAGQASLRYCSSCCLPYFRLWHCFCVERGLISLLPLFSVIAFLYGFFRCICYIFSSSFNCKPQVLQKYFRNPVNFTQMAFHNTSDDLP